MMLGGNSRLYQFDALPSIENTSTGNNERLSSDERRKDGLAAKGNLHEQNPNHQRNIWYKLDHERNSNEDEESVGLSDSNLFFLKEVDISSELLSSDPYKIKKRSYRSNSMIDVNPVKKIDTFFVPKFMDISDELENTNSDIHNSGRCVSLNMKIRKSSLTLKNIEAKSSLTLRNIEAKSSLTLRSIEAEKSRRSSAPACHMRKLVFPTYVGNEICA